LQSINFVWRTQITATQCFGNQMFVDNSDGFFYVHLHINILNTSHLHALKDMIIWKEKIFKMHRPQIYEWNIKKLGLAIFAGCKNKKCQIQWYVQFIFPQLFITPKPTFTWFFRPKCNISSYTLLIPLAFSMEH